MKPLCRRILLLLVTLRCMMAAAVVDPATTTMTTPGWMAEIDGWSDADNRYRELCKGALIAPQWILSSGFCLIDPNHYLDNVYPGDLPDLYVKLGPNADGIEVDSYFISTDANLALFHIALPSEATPLTVSSKTAAQLLGTELTILGKQKTSSIYNSFFNPGVSTSSVTGTCQISGADFYGPNNSSLCFIKPPLTGGNTLYQAKGTVIDPKSPTAPATVLDKAATIDSSGKSLYLDFRTQKSYPCMEDLGSPLLVQSATGGYEIAGVVSAVGIASGAPICGMSMFNRFASPDAIRAFADVSYANYDFTTRCPATPRLAVVYKGAANITLSWKAVKGATGYRVHYTSSHRQVPIATIDVKEQTSITTTLPHATDFLVAVSAYNDSCTSALSKPLAINVDVH